MTKRAGPLPIFGRTRRGSTAQRQSYEALKSEIHVKKISKFNSYLKEEALLLRNQDQTN